MESTEEEKIVAAAKEKTKELHNLLSAKNLDHDKFFELIVKHSKNFDRQIMVDEYQEQFSENLFDVLNKKFSGELKEIVTFLFYNPYELDARIINNSLRGKKRDEKAVIEIICSRPYWYLQTVDQEYFRLYNIHLKDELNKEKSAEFKSFLICILTTPRAVGQSFKNEKQVSEVVNTINKHTLKKYGKEVELFKDVFVRRSREDLTLIAREFRNADSKKRNLYDNDTTYQSHYYINDKNINNDIENQQENTPNQQNINENQESINEQKNDENKEEKELEKINSIKLK